MGNDNVQATSRIRLMGAIDPDASTAAAYTSDYIAMADFAELMALIMVGEMQATSTVDAKLVQATDSSGTGVKDISGKAITQLTQAGTDSDKQALITARPEDLDLDNSFSHAALVITVATADSDIAGALFGLGARYEPETDLTSVDEIV